MKGNYKLNLTEEIIMLKTFARCNNCGSNIVCLGNRYRTDDHSLCKACGASDMTMSTVIDNRGFVETIHEIVITGSDCHICCQNCSKITF